MRKVVRKGKFGEMAASQSETAGLGTGKFLAWRSYSSRDMGKDSGIASGRSFGSISGRDIGRDIANWWTAAVEQTSTFLMDEVPATFAELSEGAKELKPQLQRGSSFSNFTLPWKNITISSKADEGSKRQEGFVSVPEASGFVPSVASPERVEISPLTTTNLGEKVQEPSASSPKPLERSLSTRGHDEKIQEPTRTSPKPFKWFPLMATECEEKILFTTEISKPAKGSSVITTNHMEMSSPVGFKSPIADVDTRMSSELSSQNSSPRESSSGESSPLSFSNSEGRAPQNFTKDVEKRPLSVMKELKLCESISDKTAEVVEMQFLTCEETSKPMEDLPVGDVKTSSSSDLPVSTTDPRIASRILESQRGTKRIPVDAAAAELEASPSDATSLFIVSQDILRGEDIAPGHTRVHASEVLQRPKFLAPEKFLTNTSDESNPNSSVKRLDGSGVGSSKRSCSSRSLAQDQHLEETDIRFSPQLTAVGTPDSRDRAVHFNKVVLPRDEIFPGNTNSLPQIKVRTPKFAEDVQGVNEKSVAWESTRATQSNKDCEDERTYVSGSLPISPQYALGESRTAKLLRRWKLKGRGYRNASDTILGKEMSPTKEGNTMKNSDLKQSSELHRNFSGSLEPRRPDFSYRNWTDPDLKTTMPTGSDREIIDPSSDMGAGRLEAHGCNEASKTSVPRKQQGNSSSETSLKKSSSWPWTFKWKWGSKSRTKSTKEVVMAAPPPLPRPSTSTQKHDKSGGIFCTSNAEDDARDAFNSQSDRFSIRGTTEKLACDRAPKHRRGWSWGAGPTAALCSGSNPVNAAFTPSQPRLPTRDAQELLLPPRKLLVPPTVNVIRENQKRGPSIEVRSASGARSSQPTADTDIFEDCFGSFRSVESSTKS